MNRVTLLHRLDQNDNLIGIPETVDFDSRDATTSEQTKEYNTKFLEDALKKKLNKIIKII